MGLCERKGHFLLRTKLNMWTWSKLQCHNHGTFEHLKADFWQSLRILLGLPRVLTSSPDFHCLLIHIIISIMKQYITMKMMLIMTWRKMKPGTRVISTLQIFPELVFLQRHPHRQYFTSQTKPSHPHHNHHQKWIKYIEDCSPEKNI